MTDAASTNSSPPSTAVPAPSTASTKPTETPEQRTARKRRRRNRWFVVLLVLILLGTIGRLILPYWVVWYVNGVIDQSKLYHGTIGSVELHILRGGYTIRDIHLSKVTGNVPVPLFTCPELKLNIEPQALLSGRIVGRVIIESPEINFVDAPDKSAAQTGATGPWLAMIRNLFPFQINSAVVHHGAVHFRAYQVDPPVDVYLSGLEASIDDLTNVNNDTAPLVTTITASALAMDQAKFQLKIKLDPFSYNPTFELGMRLIGLDVTQTNALTQAYGGVNFKNGFFDLVVEINAHEGEVDGYIKPLFRNLQVFDLKRDLNDDNPLQFFWQGVVGTAVEIIKNHPRDQLATRIPVSGSLDSPQPDILVTLGNVLRNCFIRAYLPRFEGDAPDLDGLDFGAGSTTEPLTEDQPPESPNDH
jgi:hypothetical protein